MQSPAIAYDGTQVLERILDADCVNVIRNWIGQVNRRITSTVAYRGIRCTIILEPFESQLPTAYVPGSDCKRDVLELLRDVGQGLTQPQMLEHFQGRGIIHAPRTLTRALAELVGAGDLIAPGRVSSRGYHFPK
jgi:hypothetical protein